jgi:thiol:disulfide interchange protein
MKFKLNHLITGIILLFTIVLSNITIAQQVQPVSWKFSTESLDNNNVNLIVTGQVLKDWHLYTINMDDGGPMPLFFEFNESDKYSLSGDISESPKPKSEFDDIFKVTVKYHAGKVVYKQTIERKTEKAFTITGFLEGQACYEIDGQCVLVSKDMQFDIPAAKPNSSSSSDIDETFSDFTHNQDNSNTHINSEKEQQRDESEITEKPISETSIATDKDENTTEQLSTSVVNEGNAESTKNNNKGFWGFLLMAIGGGLLGVLTPCVFPMIPMTVSFFLQGNSTRANGMMKALIFGISIIFLYTLVGLIVSLTSAGADLTTVLSTSWIANAIFFILFLIFALSFFGLFEITLPTGLANKADQQVDKGGFLASFFMAVTLVIVSFSCTGPIVGAILVKGASSGSWLEPTIGMLGFGFGFALPFTLLAFSPSLLKKLPKSGGWMNSVKVVFAFILLAFSMKFISNIDQTYNLNLLSRDLYIAIWVVLFFLLGVYLLGKLKFSHDSDLNYVGVFRFFLAVIAFSFSLYLLPGIIGAKLTPVASVLPPMSAQNFDISASNNTMVMGETKNYLCDEPKHADFLEYTNNIQGYFDYQQALECAKEQNKPLLVYFSGHGCSNCKQMQSYIWEDPRVQNILNTEIIITKLLTDERKELPESEWYTSKVDGKVKKTIGKQNLDLQINKFNMNAQPFYAFVNPMTGELLIEKTMQFEKNPDKFIEFLENGIDAMK